MSLKVLQPGKYPLGQFDGLDSELLTFVGGEVVTLTSVDVPSADLAAADSFDGYQNPGKRTVVTKTLTATSGPLFLADEGYGSTVSGDNTGYGTLLGSVVGGTVGQSLSGAHLGPSTATGSGKITLHGKPGLYAVSLDACDTDATTGLQPTNATLKAGDELTYMADGKLTPLASGSGVGTKVVGRFVEFEGTGSLVTSGQKGNLKYAVFFFSPEG